jgi:hypothetical protein
MEMQRGQQLNDLGAADARIIDRTASTARSSGIHSSESEDSPSG